MWLNDEVTGKTVPYMVIGRQILEYSSGPDRNKKRNERKQASCNIVIDFYTRD